MSDTTRCPTCGGVARIVKNRADAEASPTLVAITDEAKSQKIEQLKAALNATRAKLDAAIARIAELERPS